MAFVKHGDETPITELFENNEIQICKECGKKITTICISGSADPICECEIEKRSDDNELSE